MNKHLDKNHLATFIQTIMNIYPLNLPFIISAMVILVLAIGITAKSIVMNF